jgi:hypothetical protein
MENKNIKDVPIDWWKSEGEARRLNLWFKKHIIALQIGYLLEGKAYNSYSSGFLLLYQNRCLWITAGHVLQKIDDLFQNEKCDVKRTAWIDNNEINTANEFNAIPFDYLQARKFCKNNDKMDLGVIRLEDLYLRTIAVNQSNKWLTEDTWRNNNLSNPEGFFLVGYPDETKVCGNEKRSDGNYSISKISCISNPVEKIARKESDKNEFWNYPDWFYGKALPITKDDSTKLNNIEGMSGGPILGIERTPDERVIYKLFGIQSSWLPQSKILRATPIENVITLIDEAIKTNDDN